MTEAQVDLTTPLMYVKGVGPQRGALLQAKGLETVSDLLLYAPFRYEDRTNLKPLRELAPGEMVTVIVEVSSARSKGPQKLGLFEVDFRDNSTGRLRGKWFHGTYLQNVLVPGLRVALYGKVEMDTYSRDLLMMHPEFEVLGEDDEDGDSSLHTGRVTPIYEAAGKITAKQFRVLVRRVLDALSPVEDPLPPNIRERLKLPDLWTAIKTIHCPEPTEDLRLLNSFRSQAQVRMIFEEFFWLECGLALKRLKAQQIMGLKFELHERVREKIKAMLPFKPTGAQKKVLGEIAADLTSGHPMNRLMQGDVGSGKTLVAAEAAVIAIENGYQVAVLAPTEILAQQHFFYFKNLFQKIGYPVIGLTGSMSDREKGQVKKMIAAGLVKIVVGTHAILQESVEFQKLGLAIVDEQHRFGVMQRLSLMQKGLQPHVLVMTATPIPRTLAMTIYGDLDVSVIDELPPGRKPITTKHVKNDHVEQVYAFLRQEIDEGRQAYVVYPLVDESETQAVKAATKMHQELSEVVFPSYRVGLLHGKMPPSKKEAVMADFKAGQVDILVSTTVIEVGVDVPNASVMVIEQAERFGLSQLHQLRGRVGRGPAQSFCILVTEKLSEAGRERIRTMVDSSDGFYIAEMDLRLRGPGEFFGTKQSGLPALKFGNILRDPELLEEARGEAQSFIEHPPSEEALRVGVAYLRENWQRRYGLVQVG